GPWAPTTPGESRRTATTRPVSCRRRST
ncbi:membrane protein, partial [Streptomyces variabilis]